MKRSAMVPDLSRKRSVRSAWETARDHGVDVSLIEANLRRTPAQRLLAHRRALADITRLRDAVQAKHGRP